VLHSIIKKLAAITVILTMALSITSCNAGNETASITLSEASHAAQNQNSSIPIQAAGNHSNQNTSGASNQTTTTAQTNPTAQTNQTDPADSPLTAAPDSQNSSAEFGAAGAAADQELTLTDMLTFAIEDEYLAHDEYQYIIETFGSRNPFSNIIKAEETHISMLLPLFEQYTIPVPEDQSGNYLILPASITEALQAGVQAEINNIAMYDTFLAQNLPDDIRVVFENLRDASLKHLDAFQKPRG